MKEASVLAKKATTLATSSGSPSLPNRTLLFQDSKTSGLVALIWA
tara:strand:- start:126 stop:260 length:135 start_codon:yes stop_codon:yes gene_type:complete